MWDILDFIPERVALVVSNKRGQHVFKFPWKSPAILNSMMSEKKAQQINVPDDALFHALLVRAKVHAFSVTSQLARAVMNGQVPRNLDELQRESIKFIFRRYRLKLMDPDTFMHNLTHCALLAPIPESFWDALSEHLGSNHLQKLKAASKLLERFHLPEDQWRQDALMYMSRVLWMKDQFEDIAFAAAQLAICYPESPLKADFSELSKKAKGIMASREIEADMANVKPWQKGPGGVRRTISSAPKVSRKKPADLHQEE